MTHFPCMKCGAPQVYGSDLCRAHGGNNTDNIVNSYEILLKAAKEADRLLSDGHKGRPISRARNRARDILQQAIAQAEVDL